MNEVTQAVVYVVVNQFTPDAAARNRLAGARPAKMTDPGPGRPVAPVACCGPVAALVARPST